MPVRAVLFDLDGTLWDAAPWWRGDDADWAKVESRQAERIGPLFAAWGIDAPPGPFMEDFRHRADARDRRDLASLKAVNGQGLVSEYAGERGIRLERDQALQAWNALDLPASAFGRQAYEDALPTLRRLKEMGFRTAVVSNRWSATGKLFEDLREARLGQSVDVAITSADVG